MEEEFDEVEFDGPWKYTIKFVILLRRVNLSFVYHNHAFSFSEQVLHLWFEMLCSMEKIANKWYVPLVILISMQLLVCWIETNRQYTFWTLDVSPKRPMKSLSSICVPVYLFVFPSVTKFS